MTPCGSGPPAYEDVWICTNPRGHLRATGRDARFPVRGRALLQFRGKSGARHEVRLDDARLAGLVRRCQELPGHALFQHLDSEGHRHAIDSGQVNDYLRE